MDDPIPREMWKAAEAGELPLEVLADYLEGLGDPRADGVRWLAERGKRPAVPMWSPKTQWLSDHGMSLGIEFRLPDEIVNSMIRSGGLAYPVAFETFSEAIYAAAEAATREEVTT